MKVAVLLATYNGEMFLKKQIESLLNQTYSDFDIYISDDGSTDKTLEIIKEISINHNNIHLLKKSAPSGSACKNFLYLLENVNSDLYCFCDQDDVWEIDHVENLVSKAKTINPKIPFLIHTDLFVVNQELELLNDSFFKYSNLVKNPQSYKYYLLQNNVTGCTMCINDILKNIIFRERFYDQIDMIPMHDWWFALIAKRFGEVIFLPSKGLKYRQHSLNQVGAKNVNSISYKISRFFNTSKNKKSINMSINISSAFFYIYGNDISENEKIFLNNYINIKKKNKIKRIGFIVKNSFWKDNLSRIIMQILYI